MKFSLVKLWERIKGKKPQACVSRGALVCASAHTSGYARGYGCGSSGGYGHGWGCGAGDGYAASYGWGDGDGYGEGYGNGDGSGSTYFAAPSYEVLCPR